MQPERGISHELAGNGLHHRVITHILKGQVARAGVNTQVARVGDPCPRAGEDLQAGSAEQGRSGRGSEKRVRRRKGSSQIVTMGQISDPARGEARPGPTRRSAARALQAVAFDAIGARYGEAFPAKNGQLAAGRRLLDELAPGDRVLDIGCGTGDPTVRQLAEAGMAVTAIDLSDGMLSLARRTLPDAAAYHRMDLYDLSTDRAESAWGVPELGHAGAQASRRPPRSSR